jgi:hypothetical protein
MDSLKASILVVCVFVCLLVRRGCGCGCGCVYDVDIMEEQNWDVCVCLYLGGFCWAKKEVVAASRGLVHFRRGLDACLWLWL